LGGKGKNLITFEKAGKNWDGERFWSKSIGKKRGRIMNDANSREDKRNPRREKRVELYFAKAGALLGKTP